MEISRLSTDLKRALNQINGPQIDFNLPQDIITEIFVRLPVKSLLRFKSCSKSSYCLISSKSFIKKHLDNSAKDTNYTNHSVIASFLIPRHGLKQYSLSSFLYEPTNDAVNVEYPVMSDYSDMVHLVGCHNGLCCFITFAYDFILWNPFTREFKKLPDIDYIIGMSGSRVTNYGFGYDEGGDDYRVLGMVSVHGEASYEPVTKIYSLKTNSWKRMKGYNAGAPYYGPGLFLNNRLHWDNPVGTNGLKIVSLDIGNGVNEEMELPNCVKVGSCPFLGVLGGCLSLICNNFPAPMEIWVMQQYGVNDSWFKLANIPQPGTYSMRPMFLTSEGEILVLCGTSFRVYDPNRKVLKESQVVTNFHQFVEAYVCVQSLVSLS